MSALYEKIRKIIKEQPGYNGLSPVLEALSNIKAEKLTPLETQRFRALVSEVMSETLRALTQVSQIQQATMPLHDNEQHNVSGDFGHYIQNSVAINYLKFKYPDFIDNENLDVIEIIEIADVMPGTTEYSIIKVRYKDGKDAYATGTRMPSESNKEVSGCPIHFSAINPEIKKFPYFVKTMKNGHRIMRIESSVQHHIENLLQNLQIIQRLSERFQGL